LFNKMLIHQVCNHCYKILHNVCLPITVQINKFNIFISLTGKISQYQPNKLRVIPHVTVIAIKLVPAYQHYFMLPCILTSGLYSVVSDSYICYTKYKEKVRKWKHRLLILWIQTSVACTDSVSNSTMTCVMCPIPPRHTSAGNCNNG
jgi:hypothetical protein